MIVNVASKLVSKLAGIEIEENKERDNFIKKSLGLASAGIPIGREHEPAGYIRWKAETSDGSFQGSVAEPDEDTSLAWHEYLWTNRVSVDECDWEQVRWRFYRNGLVCFESRMSNTSGRLDNGDVQGHRIELREKSGLLLGVWIAGFFVRKDLPMRGFATSYVDEHQPLKLHFADLGATPTGAWVCL